MSDLISRQAVLDVVKKWFDKIQLNGDICLDGIVSLPSVENKGEDRPKGHWIKTISENGITSAVRCSECGFEDNRYMLFRYCPNCGADMRKAEKPETCEGCLEPCIMYEPDMRACKKKVKAESEDT